MKKKWYASLVFYVVAPFVILGALATLVLAFYAAFENYRLGRATEQILYVVSFSRDLRISPTLSSDEAQALFFSQIKQVLPSDVVQVADSFLGEKAELGLMNPWDKPMRVYFYPSWDSLRIETPLSSSACRQVLLFYAKNTKTVGLKRVDIRAADPGAVWRLVYQEQAGNSALTSNMVYGGCGNDGQDILSLTFSL